MFPENNDRKEKVLRLEIFPGIDLDWEKIT